MTDELEKRLREHYVEARARTLSQYPTPRIFDHATKLVQSYLNNPFENVDKNSVTWLTSYLKSSEFIDCDDLEKIASSFEELSEQYQRGLKILADIEYSSRFHPDSMIRQNASQSIRNLEERGDGCGFD